MKAKDIVEAIDDAAYGWRLHEDGDRDIDPSDVIASIVRRLMEKLAEGGVAL